MSISRILEEKVARKDTVNFCMIEFKKVRKNTARLYEELRQEYKKLELYSRGEDFISTCSMLGLLGYLSNKGRK